MTRYLISFPDGAMDYIPEEEMPAVANAAHAVVQEALIAGRVPLHRRSWNSRGRVSWPPTGRSPTARTRGPRN